MRDIGLSFAEAIATVNRGLAKFRSVAEAIDQIVEFRQGFKRKSRAANGTLMSLPPFVVHRIRISQIFESETTLVNFSLGYLKTIVADLSDEDLTTLTESTGKTPQWILGHLHIASELGSKLLGSEPACGDDWFAAFGPGSKPGASDAPAFALSAILVEIENGYQRLLERCKAAPEAILEEKHGFEPLEPALSTKRDLMSHLLTTHITYHLAQLSACRQAKGLSPVF